MDLEKSGRGRADKLDRLEELHGYRFRDRELLRRALTHPSYAFEHGQPSNERLEFLGDAVLSLLVAERLYRDRPEAAEGDLTQRRAELVRGTYLAVKARDLQLGSFLGLGRGEEKQGGRRTPSNLANALEAVIGAIFLDGGLQSARQFIQRHFTAAAK